MSPRAAAADISAGGGDSTAKKGAHKVGACERGLDVSERRRSSATVEGRSSATPRPTRLPRPPKRTRGLRFRVPLLAFCGPRRRPAPVDPMVAASWWRNRPSHSLPSSFPTQRWKLIQTPTCRDQEQTR